MILNLSYSENDILIYLNKSSDRDTIMDLTGVVSSSFTQNEFRNIRMREGALDAEERAIARYIDFCGRLSRLNTGHGNIRDLRVAGFPVYWVTDIAVKHYEIHWLSAIFFLEELLKSCVVQFPADEVVKVIVPKGALHSKQLILDIFQQNGLRVPQIISRGQNSELFYLTRFVKEVLLNLFAFLKLKLYLKGYKRNEAKLAGRDIFIINIYASVWEKAKWENYWAEHYTFFSSKASTWVTPFFNRYIGSEYYDFSKAPDKFLAALPGFRKILSIAAQSVGAYLKSFFYFKGSNHYVGIEFRKALASMGYFISHAWYKDFAAQLYSQSLAIYDEEMYYAGRVLSHAFESAANTKMHYFGLQHGLFFNPNHTVYSVTDNEIVDLSKGDGFPLPQKFIVWGDFFKKSFLKNNSLPEDFLLTLGSIKHSGSAQPTLLESKRNSGCVNILWCTTLVHYAKLEFNIMRDALQALDGQINLVIRKHPYVHLPDETLLQLISGIRLNSITISANKNIREDLAQADIVVSTSGSTTFLDALLADKLSVRIYNYASYPALQDVLTSTSFLIYTSNEFKNLIQNVVNNALILDAFKEEGISQFIYTDKDRWENFIHEALKHENIETISRS